MHKFKTIYHTKNQTSIFPILPTIINIFALMKKILFAIFIFIITISCRGEHSENIQQINQVLHIYIKDTLEMDLLNTKIKNAYQKVEIFDIGGERAETAIPFSLKTNINSISYLEYVAGAIRKLADSNNSQIKYYQSDIILKLKKNNAIIEQDTIKLLYEWTPNIFQLKKLNYNRKNIPIRKEKQANIITIIK